MFKLSKIALVALLCGCMLSQPSFAATQTWYFVRHFEKQQGDDPHLTEQGQNRAVSLAKYFTNQELTQVYSTAYNRTKQTAKPVAAALDIKVKSYNPRELTLFAAELKKQDKVLVVGHSNTTPQLLELMGGDKVSIAESEYGTLYILQKQDGDLKTSQVSIIAH